MTTPAGTWTSVLAALETDLAATDAALTRNDVVSASAWDPPQGLGPLPTALAGRAARLVERIEDVQRRACTQAAGLGGELDDLERRRGASVAYLSDGKTGIA